ncbi:MAG: PQQ-binding-like beta-propeller repeat protein [Thermomicrobiales bacterium]
MHRRTFVLLAAFAPLAATTLGRFPALAQEATPAAPELGADWPIYRGDPARTGAPGVRGPVGDPVLLWSFAAPSSASRTPALAGGVAYLTAAKALYAMDALTGEALWQVDIATDVETTPTVADGGVYFMALDGTLIAVDLATRAERWRFAEPVNANSSPVVAGSLIIIGNDDTTLFAIDATTGAEAWRYDAGAALPRAAAVRDDTIYIGNANGEVLALDLTGSELWRSTPPAGEHYSMGTLAVSEDAIYVVGLNEGPLTQKLDRATGEEIWGVTVSLGFRPLTVSGDLLVGSGGDGVAYGLDADTGDVLWQFPTGENIQASAAVADGVAYVASYDRNLYALDAATGEERWRYEIDGELTFGPSVAYGIVYASTSFGTLYAIGGSESWPGAGATPVAALATPLAAAPALAAEGSATFRWRAEGKTPLARAYGMAIAPDGNIWVSDGLHNQFQIFSPDGEYVETWGKAGSGDGEFDFAVEGGAVSTIAFRPDGGFYVTDTGNTRVQQFAADRSFVRAWGESGTGDGQFVNPLSVAIAPDGRVYVIDDQRDDVQVFSPEGEFVEKFAEHGSGPGQLASTGFGAFDPAGNFWVADWGNARVVGFAPDHTFLRTFGERGSGHGQFQLPSGIATDAAGRIYVTDDQNVTLRVFTPEGELLAAWTGDDIGGSVFGGPNGNTSISGMGTVALDGAGTLYVLDYQLQSNYDAGYGALQAFTLLPPLAP